MYAQHEQDKKLQHNDLVMNVERGTLTPSFFLLLEMGKSSDTLPQTTRHRKARSRLRGGLVVFLMIFFVFKLIIKNRNNRVYVEIH